MFFGKLYSLSVESVIFIDVDITHIDVSNEESRVVPKGNHIQPTIVNGGGGHPDISRLILE